MRRATKKTHILPQFHLGLVAQLQHEHGSRLLIDTLNSYGLCASYSDLRGFLTSLTVVEMEKNKDEVYVPTGIVHRNEGGNLIHEGDDNADINVKTIDANITPVFYKGPCALEMLNNFFCACKSKKHCRLYLAFS